MERPHIALITDSGTNTPPDFCQAHDVRVVPLTISYADGSTYESGVDIDAREVAERLATEIPKTSLPSPQRITDELVHARDEGFDAAVFVTISAGLSGTWQAVRLVADSLTDFPVAVIDTRSIGLAAGLVVMEAARLIEAGLRLDEIRLALQDVAERTRVFFTTKTLAYLRAGGRISEAVYRLGSLINVKPVITCDEAGVYRVAAKPRGWRRALEAEVRLATEAARAFSRVRLAVCCTESADHFDELERKLTDAVRGLGVEVAEVVRGRFSADLIVHTGPDTVGVACQGIA